MEITYRHDLFPPTRDRLADHLVAARTDEFLLPRVERNRAFECGAWQAAVSLAATRSQAAMTTGKCLTLNRVKLAFFFAFAVVIGIHAKSTVGGNRGHEIVAIIAADNLTPAAREQAAGMLGSASLLVDNSLKPNSN